MYDYGIERLTPMREWIPQGEMTMDNAFGKELKNRISPVKVVVDECGFM